MQVFKKHPSGLGDMLYESRSAWGQEDCLWILPEKSIGVASLLLGSVPVHVDGPKRKGTLNMETVPFVHLSESEVSSARSFISHFQNPLIVCLNCNPFWMPLRSGPQEKWDRIMGTLSERFTLLQFGAGEVVNIPRAVKFIGLPLRMVAACYCVVGSYVGIDTGNVHLMLSVGGKVVVATPPDCSDHQHSIWHYRHPNARYLNFDDMGQIPDMV